MGREERLCQNLMWGSHDLPTLPFLWEHQQSTNPSHDGLQRSTADMLTLAASLHEGLLSTKSTRMFSSVYTLTTHRYATCLLGATRPLRPMTVCGISIVMSGPKVPLLSVSPKWPVESGGAVCYLLQGVIPTSSGAVSLLRLCTR